MPTDYTRAYVQTYAGVYIDGPMSAEDAVARVRLLNDALNPWERMAGYYYQVGYITPLRSNDLSALNSQLTTNPNTP